MLSVFLKWTMWIWYFFIVIFLFLSDSAADWISSCRFIVTDNNNKVTKVLSCSSSRSSSVSSVHPAAGNITFPLQSRFYLQVNTCWLTHGEASCHDPGSAQ